MVQNFPVGRRSMMVSTVFHGKGQNHFMSWSGTVRASQICSGEITANRSKTRSSLIARQQVWNCHLVRRFGENRYHFTHWKTLEIVRFMLSRLKLRTQFQPNWVHNPVSLDNKGHKSCKKSHHSYGSKIKQKKPLTSIAPFFRTQPAKRECAGPMATWWLSRSI